MLSNACGERTALCHGGARARRAHQEEQSKYVMDGHADIFVRAQRA